MNRGEFSEEQESGGIQRHSTLNAQRNRLIEDVLALADEIGPRNSFHFEALQRAERYLLEAFRDAGFRPLRQEYKVEGLPYANIIAEVPGNSRKQEIVVIGAHYDTHRDSPGANGNGSAIAALLALARYFRQAAPARTLRFVAFTNEERPFTRTELMGSRVYAKNCRRHGDNIVAMLCLEAIGCFSNEENSQRMSFHGRVLPSKGNFLAVVANKPSQLLLNHVVSSLSLNSHLSYEALTLPSYTPGAITSDHWAFWQEKFPAILITDTAPFRSPHYHKTDDTPEKVDFDWLDNVVESMKQVVTDLVIPSDLAGVAPEPYLEWQEAEAFLPKRTLLLAGVGLGLLGAAVLLNKRLDRHRELNRP